MAVLGQDGPDRGSGELVDDATSPVPTARPTPLHSEQDPEDWWRATIATVRELGRRHDLKRVRGIGLSGQMHGAVLLDARHRVPRTVRVPVVSNTGTE